MKLRPTAGFATPFAPSGIEQLHAFLERPDALSLDLNRVQRFYPVQLRADFRGSRRAAKLRSPKAAVM
jgi:hypothetical protein